MELEHLIFPYWLVFAALIGGAIYIRKFKIIPTLKKHGRDYEEYISLKKQRKQLNEYIEICKGHGLPNLHWRYMKIFNKVGFVLVIGWVFLIYVVEQ
jgi:hypothetical protein